jgi:hypothetical protein
LPSPSNRENRRTEFTVDRVRVFLEESYGPKRPPEVTARLLTFLIEMHKQGRPYPSRSQVAEHLAASPYGIDAAINRAMERDLIHPEIKTADGHISKRSSVVQRKHYIPSKALMDAAQKPPHARR